MSDILENYGDLQVGVQDLLVSNGVSTFYPLAKIKRAIGKAYAEALMLFQWPQLEVAEKVFGGTTLNYIYSYPENFMTNSIARLVLNGKKYTHIEFDDFLNWKYQETAKPVGKYYFATYGRQYFVDPVATAISQDLFIWGAEMADPLTDDVDETIFTTNEPMGNEAIVKLATGKLMPTAGKKKEGQAEESEGAAMLASIFQKIQMRKMNAQRLNKSLFTVPDLFPRRGGKGPIGNF